MKTSALWSALITLLTLAFISLKLDGIDWPWWSWNPIQPAVFIVWTWALYFVASSIVVGWVTWLLKAVKRLSSKDGER